MYTGRIAYNDTTGVSRMSNGNEVLSIVSLVLQSLISMTVIENKVLVMLGASLWVRQPGFSS
jgi:hypothetical protein